MQVFHTVANDYLNQKFSQAINSLLADVYEHLTDEDKELLNKKMTPEILQSFYPAITTEFIESKLCIARVHGGNQCQRQKKPNYEYCCNHLNWQPHGNIHSEYKPKQKAQKQTILDIEQLKKGDYVETKIITFENISYMLDTYGIIYNTDAVIVGQFKEGKIYWFK